MIRQANEMTEYRFEHNNTNSKLSCKHITQVNVSNKILLGVTQGIGNAILTTPLIKALTSIKLKVDILKGGLIRGAEQIFEGMDNVKLLDEDQLHGRIYLLGLQTMWPYEGLENHVAQIRFAPNIHEVWKAGINAHEVEINMSLAYSLKYGGDIPSLYCCHAPVPDNYIPVPDVINKDKKNIGIHICRKYNHQFHANRQLRNAIDIAKELHGRGHRIFIIGHEGAVLPDTKEHYPEFIYCLGRPLENVAGLIKELDCMVNEDSGIMHVTAAMDTPQIALFGPTSDIKNAPWSKKAVVARRDMPCAPCQYTPRATNCCSNICMDVDTSYVVQRVESLI